jgi:hypothetical protein
MNIKMKVTNFLWLVFCLTQSLNAQNGVVSSGGDIASPNGSVAYSVGQMAYVPIYDETGNMNPGLQQPFQLGIVALHNDRSEYYLKLYPNPANQFVYLQVSSDEGMIRGDDFNAKVYDVKGNLLIHQRLVDAINTIKIAGLPEAFYIIQIWQSNTFIQSISFSKTN